MGDCVIVTLYMSKKGPLPKTTDNNSNILDVFGVYYESRKRELKRRLINEYRCDERLKDKVMESSYGELCLL